MQISSNIFKVSPDSLVVFYLQLRQQDIPYTTFIKKLILS